MAVKTWYVTNTILGGVHQEMSETSPGSDATSSPNYGWTVGTTDAGLYSKAAAGVERLATTFATTPVEPDGSIDATLGDCWRSTNKYTGTFAAGNWTFQLAAIAVSFGGTQDGLAGFRLFHDSSADGSTATEVTAGRLAGSEIVNLATSAQDASTHNSTSIAEFTVNDEYIFIQVGWEITGKGSGHSTAHDVIHRVGTTASLVTSTSLSTVKTQSGVALIGATTPQTQDGVARITATTAQTQDGTALISATTTQTQDGAARITAITPQTQDGVANIIVTGTTTQTQPGTASVLKATAQTQGGTARITATAAQTQDGVANIIVTGTTTQTQDGAARITATATQAQSGVASILRTTAKTQLGVARIFAGVPRRTAKGTAWIWDAGDTVTLPNVYIEQDASVVVLVTAHDDYGAFVSATWNGEALTQEAFVINAGDNKTAIYAKHGVTSAIGDVVVTMEIAPFEVGMAMAVSEWTGLADAPLDKTAGATGNGTSPSSGAAATTAQTHEVLVGAVGMVTVAADVGGTWGGSFSNGQKANSGGGASDGAISEGYRIVTATGAYTASKTGTVSAPWGALIVTYRREGQAARTQAGIARITATSAQTQGGASRITATTPQTQDGVANIIVTGTTTKTQPGTASVLKATAQTQGGAARITATATQTQDGVANILVAGTTTQTQLGTASVLRTTPQTQGGVARIGLQTVQTQDGAARVTATVAQAQAGVADIAATTQQTQDGASSISVQVAQTQAGTANIAGTTTQTQDGKTRIGLQTTQIQQGVASLLAVGQTIQIQSGRARVSLTTPREQGGRAWIGGVLQGPEADILGPFTVKTIFDLWHYATGKRRPKQ